MEKDLQVKHKGFEASRSNKKLPRTTLIFNMGSASECPSKALGLCKVPNNRCYALQAEITYPRTKPYRNRQKVFWLNNSKENITQVIIECLKTKRTMVKGKLVPLYKAIKLLRFNEAGDFWSQECVEKLDYIAKALKQYGIVTYGYTARKDLDFDNVSFLVKGSGHKKGNNGSTRVVTRKKQVKKGERLCPMNCRQCNMCSSDKGVNVAFMLH